ncbi:MAG: hypothetical protein IJ781_14870 [Atopobiaceae bacterium]|nr:hypothetical protein [Atopobiaceae bacterium]
MGREDVFNWENLKALLALLLILAAFAFAGTLDHEEDVRHAQWMAELEEEGAWVMW